MSAAPKSAAQAVRDGDPPPEPVKLITVADALDQLGELAALPITPTPFPTLNDAIGFGGFMATQNYSVAASTGRGKTSLVKETAVHAAATQDVLIATWEMVPGYFVARAAGGLLGLPSNEIVRNAKKHASAVLMAVPPRIYFLHRPTLANVKRAAEQLAQKSGRAPLVIADYLQKIADQIMAGQQRPDARLATAQASADLLNIAECVKCPVVTVSATSRVSGKRTLDARQVPPYELVDVARESGSVEYDSAATIVLSLSKERDGDERIATITVAKARFGEECHIDARFHGARGSWRDLGRVEHVPDSSIRDAVIAALAKPATSKNEIQRRTKRNKTEVLHVVDTLVSAGEILFDRSGYRLRGEP